MRITDENDTGRVSPRVARIIVAICAVIITVCIILVAIPLISNHLATIQEQQASRTAHAAEHNQRITAFPHTMKISGKSVNLSSIDIFELYGNHSYIGYVIVTIDRSNLTDDDVYWIMKGNRYNWELDANAHWWPDGNDGDIQSLHFQACRYNDRFIYFFFYTDPQRYSVKGKHFSIAVTYLQNGADYSDNYHYSYAADFIGAVYHDSIDFLPEDTVYSFGIAFAS